MREGLLEREPQSPGVNVLPQLERDFSEPT